VLLTLRVPVVDLRPFCLPDYPQGVRLPITWSEDKEFIRYFGPITRRARGPVDPWPSERVFCRYDRALRFPPSYQSLLTEAVPGLVFYGVLRRLYPANTRNDLFHADVQLTGKSSQFSARSGMRPRRYHRTEFDLVAMINAVLGLPTTVSAKLILPNIQPLGKFGPPIARALDIATTVNEASGKVIAGAPAIAMQVERGDNASTTWGRKWEINYNLGLAARTIIFNARPINIFVIKHQYSRAAQRQARELRIHLLRLHSEREYLRQMARLLVVDGFLEGCGKAQVERIQASLNESLQILTRRRSHGFALSQVENAFIADSIISGSELEVLSERVRAFRPIIGRRLENLRRIEASAAENWSSFLDEHPGGKNYIYIHEAHMSKYDQHGSQIGSAGDYSSASHFSFGEQFNFPAMTPSEVDSLQSAIRTVRRYLAGRLAADVTLQIDASEISSSDLGTAIGALSDAEDAIAAKDSRRFQAALQRSGRWLVSFAQGVGVEVAAAAIRAAMHMQ
jgi:hypothetical protein